MKEQVPQMNTEGMEILRFWGKARPLDSGCGPKWHPLAFHCLDVAAVGHALLTRHSGLREGLLYLLGVPREEAVRLICFLLCLHDIGKFAKKFQAKVPALYPSCFDDAPYSIPTYYDHGAGGLRLFDAKSDLFKLPSGVSPGTWRSLISAIAGHHGVPPEPQINETLVVLRRDYGKEGIAAAGRFIQQAHELFDPPQKLCLDRRRVRPASFALAGVAVLADWIGSSQQWFPYCEPEPFQDLSAYWSDAKERAARTIEEAGVLPAGMGDPLSYDALIGAKASPSPMQDWARCVNLPPGPVLFMIEDETGSGKTEAAIMLAHRMMATGRADGLYIALPTMATANAMFDRLCVVHRKLFAADREPSVALAHGARDLHRGFRSAVLRGGRKEDPYSKEQDAESETTASAACTAWIADDRRRAFLADVGAGTMDQALLSVLPSRHQSLRLLGLMRRVLVLDEVHAYDAYMQREIETLLEFQAGLGGSAILLSATLPPSIRKRLADAFLKGTGDVVEMAGEGSDYPLATVCAAGVRASTKVAGQKGRARTLPVRFLRTPNAALDEIEKAGRDGKAVLYIRNTVDDALDAHADLAARGLVPDLFHARFALADRLQKEEQVVKTFGKRSVADERAGKVLIATQVVEQSLDLDFDVLITDLAPIDLVIQRAGRLWRHDRPEREGRPELLVVGPEPDADAKEDWFSNAFPRAAYVYRDHARLWLTAKALEETGVIKSPGGLRALIEAVYGEEAELRVPSSLEGIFYDAEGKAGAERGVATTNTLNFTEGYMRNGGAWDSDERIPTRLADDPQVTLRLACIRDGRVVPYAQDIELWRAWRLSEVNVTTRRVSGEAVSPKHEAIVREAKRDWTRFDADKVLVLLERNGDAEAGFWGSAVSADEDVKKGVRLSYHPRMGLKWLD